MPFYIGDYLRDTQHLNAEKHGAYVLLIFAYWASGKPLVDDDEHLATICRMPLKRWRSIRPVIERFFQQEAGEWRHKRIDAELTKAEHNISKRRAAGLASAQQRANKRSTHVEHVSQQTGRPSPSPSPSPKEEAAALPREGLGIIRRFDDLAAATFGEPLRRAFPDSTDLVIADRWLAAGADMALCEGVFSALMGRMKGRGQGPPKSLKYFDQAVSDALKTANSPMPEGKSNGRPPGRLSAAEGLYEGFARELGKREQQADRGAGSDPPQPLLDSRHGSEAAPAPKL